MWLVLVNMVSLAVVMFTFLLPRGRRESIMELWLLRRAEMHLILLVNMPGAATLMAVGRPTTTGRLGAGPTMLTMVPYILMVQLGLALAKDLGEHLQHRLTFPVLDLRLPYSLVVLAVSPPTLLPPPWNMILCRSIDIEPQKRMTVCPVFPSVLQAWWTRRLWYRASIMTAMLLGTSLCLTSTWTKLKLALEVDGKFILTLPNFTEMSRP